MHTVPSLKVVSRLLNVLLIKFKFLGFWNLEDDLHILSLCATMQLSRHFCLIGNFLYQIDRPGVKANPGKLT